MDLSLFPESNSHLFPRLRSLLFICSPISCCSHSGSLSLGPLRLTGVRRKASKDKRSGEVFPPDVTEQPGYGLRDNRDSACVSPVVPWCQDRPSVLGVGPFPTKLHLLLLGVLLIMPKHCTTTGFSNYRMPRPNSVQRG